MSPLQRLLGWMRRPRQVPAAMARAAVPADMSTNLSTLLQRWCFPLPPEPPLAVISVFAELSTRATADVIALYGAIGGMEMMDDTMWRLWSLKEIKAENTQRSEYGILFSDFLINSWCFRLRANSDDTSSVYIDYFDDKAPLLIAGTLEEFLASYIDNPQTLVNPDS